MSQSMKALTNFVNVSKSLPSKNQICFVRLKTTDAVPIQIEPIKCNAVYDHSEKKWVMYDKSNDAMVEICGEVKEWRIDPHPMIEVSEV